MKRKRVKNLPLGEYVKCSFCKCKNAEKQLVGYPYYGRTVCDSCYNELEEKETRDCDYISQGEEQAYNMYKVY